MNQRKAKFERKSKETDITAEINIDGTGKTGIATGIGILDHMLELFAFHGYFDLDLKVQKADLEIDIHHTNEDVGIVLGKLFKKALDAKEGIRRFGSAFAPMEATLGHTVVDISGRGYFSPISLETNYPISIKQKAQFIHVDNEVQLRGVLDEIVQDGYAFKYLEHFLESFAHNLGATIKVKISYPTEDLHTNLETVFKSLGLALDQATQIDPRRSGTVPSTKGIID
jgi:imidazoleglycerol-phosphate dehydratase